MANLKDFFIKLFWVVLKNMFCEGIWLSILLQNTKPNINSKETLYAFSLKRCKWEWPEIYTMCRFFTFSLPSHTFFGNKKYNKNWKSVPKCEECVFWLVLIHILTWGIWSHWMQCTLIMHVCIYEVLFYILTRTIQ